MRSEAHIDNLYTVIILRLNASSLISPNSFIVELFSVNISSSLKSLVDSSSSHCFIETNFIKDKNIPTFSIDPLPLSLFDGSINTTITEAVDLDITLDGTPTLMTFYVTNLDSSCDTVLGHNWLTRYNPSINWVLGNISFQRPSIGESSASVQAHKATASKPLNTSDRTSDTCETYKTSKDNSVPPNIPPHASSKPPNGHSDTQPSILLINALVTSVCNFRILFGLFPIILNITSICLCVHFLYLLYFLFMLYF